MDANSQTVKTYDAAWKRIEDFVKKNLPKSALQEVKKIYQLAKKEKQDAQVIKSLVYMTGLQNENRENNDVLSIAEIEKERSTSKEPVTAIFNSMLAEMYWNYYQQYRWQLYNRAETTAFKKDDISTWSAGDFHSKIGQLYLASIQQVKLLQQTKLTPFDAIIIKGNVRHLRPTLFDLLAHRALSYFENDERDISRPAYAFEINESYAFDDAAEFINHKFTTRDTVSLQYHALLIYQQLISFHLKDTKIDALIDADLKRLQFVRQKSVAAAKDDLYFKAINRITKRYENLPAVTQAWYLVAAYQNEKANEYKPYGDTTNRYARLKAKEICERVLAQKDSSEGRVNCFNLLNEINQESLQLQLEKVNIPGQPFRAFVEYKNFNRLYLRIIRPDDNLRKQLEDQYNDKYWSSILGASAVRNWEQALPETADLQQHNVEIKVDALPSGEYMIIAGTNKNFSDRKTLVGARLFYVSNIGFVNNGEDFFVLNRDNGQPLKNASVQVWEHQYNYTQSKYLKQKTKLYKTDANGFFKKEMKYDAVRKTYNNNSFQLDITHGSDRLFMNDMISNYYYYRGDGDQDARVSTSVFLFTDRSLYRPGQTVYFKGIVLNRTDREKKAWVNEQYETTILLRDANYQDIDSIRVKTNEFGSFAGKFQLPPTGLNGSFSLFTRFDNGHTQFNVEEYKRPKFYVEYKPLKGTYKVNDTISLTGTAMAYAGNNIDGALVKYRVVRKPRFLYPWLFWRGWWPPSEPMEIAHGETTTDDEGKFIVHFTAIPDLKLDRKLEPVFDYAVYADVTDINGETRSAEQTVSVSYKALLLKTSVPAMQPVDSLTALSIRTENMNGEFEPAMVHVIISRLTGEKRLIRERYWERPDQFVISKDEYIKNFPNDEYDDETDPKTWVKEETVFDKIDSTRESAEFGVDSQPLKPGFYIIEISTKDKYGEEVKDVKYLQLFDEKDKHPGTNQYLSTNYGKTIEPGEKTTVTIATAAEDLFVVQQVDRNIEPGAARGEPGENDRDISYTFLKLNEEKHSIDFTATEADRGGFGVSWMFVKHNRVFQNGHTISVPWTNKDLKIAYATFRDKTLPGSEEKWTLKISGYKSDAVAAEMLAGMYDASLDQFYPHQWNKPAIWPEYENILRWNGSPNFTNVVLLYREYIGAEYKQINKAYDQFSFYGKNVRDIAFYNVRRSLNGRVAGLEMEEMKAAEPQAVSTEIAGNSVGLTDTSILLQDGDMYVHGEMVKKPAAPVVGNTGVQIRKNFNETAFFFPELKTDSSGSITFSFTIPETLTRWKFQALAHTKEGALGYSSKEIVTQKQLMVQPNPPRFLREGDKMELSTKIVNLTGKELTGQAALQLFDATTNQPVDGWFNNMIPNQFFTVAAGQSESVRFPIAVPFQFNKALVWRIVAKAGDFSDGEESALPVLTNRMLVTETLSLPMRGSGTKNFTFEKLKNIKSETLQHHALTVEYTSNPAWFAIQSLPYLMEYPYDCAEQTWNRYYANSLASLIANSSPRIRQVFEQWKTLDTAALMSNLQKNEELKSVLLEETPWVLQAKSESEQKKNIGLLFDMVRMSNELNGTYDKLKQMQSSNGGFVWFKGGPDDRYMTQYIVTGIGHLKKLNAVSKSNMSNLNEILGTAIPYLDKKIKEDYDDLIKNKTDLKKYIPDYSAIHYLYMRSFFPEIGVPAASKKAYDYFIGRAKLNWTKQNKYMQGMLALALNRIGDSKTAIAIVASLKETAITDEESGMYWKDARRGWFWHEAPIERQALLIEAFGEVANDKQAVENLKTWLLKNKQTNRWESTKATAEACYALLLSGTNWLQSSPVVTIKLGNTSINSEANKIEAGTGYFKKTFESKDVKPAMGDISVSISTEGKDSPGVSWGAVYWQYFEDLDKITVAATPLNLVKKLFVEKNTDRGPVLTAVNEGDILKVGDKIKVRIKLRVDRDMEYVHMKDMRASAMEPVNVLSGYKWQEGLGYYESTKDASTNFFFSSLRKGTYVFEYPLFITHPGNFSNGITSIQCMYAPEFSAHSEGTRINIE
jgi:hypothetical protein